MSIYYNEYQVQREMAKSGVSWFKFDEPSGNVTDSKGTAVGTINGGVTRIAGFNGEGRALNFNGVNSYVQFNQKVIPIGKKSIVFEFKRNGRPSSTELLIDSSSYNWSNHGMSIWINTDGRIVWSVYRAVINTSIFDIFSTYVCDGRRHGITFTWDGTTDSSGVKVYVDNRRIPVSTATARSTELRAAPYNMRLGASNSNSFYFNGQIDNLEIYNDVIDPLAHKHLILSNNEAYTAKSGEWENVGIPTNQTYVNLGMDTITTAQANELRGVLPYGKGKISVLKV